MVRIYSNSILLLVGAAQCVRLTAFQLNSSQTRLKQKDFSSRNAYFRLPRTALRSATTSPTSFMTNIFENLFQPPNNDTSKNKNSSQKEVKEGRETIESFLAFLNNLSPQTPTSSWTANVIDTYFDEDVEYTDTAFYKTVSGKEDLIRNLLLFAADGNGIIGGAGGISKDGKKVKIIVDDIASSSASASASASSSPVEQTEEDNCVKVCVSYHLEQDVEGSNNIIANSQGITFYQLQRSSSDEGIMKITKLFNVVEPSDPKPGDAGLNILNGASKIINLLPSAETDVDNTGTNSNSDRTVVEEYFDSWNRRDMDNAIECFATDCTYSDLQYPTPFQGKELMEKHLNRVSDCLPTSFRFVVDDLAVEDMTKSQIIDDGVIQKIGVQWHVENNDEELAFTRGCSFYNVVSGSNNEKSRLIKNGLDIPEPAVVKTGVLDSLQSKITQEPVRLVPLTLWVAYMYIVFLSDGILPGANALQLEQRTWEEVRDLSLNFFLVSPLLHLPFAPVVHPMLEGVFNLLLAWAGLFAGFLSDERDGGERKKVNLLEFGPIVIGMQFLTSAFLLPYLVTRSSEEKKEQVDQNGTNAVIYKEDIKGSIQQTVSEWKPLGTLLGTVGTGSIIWAFLARPEFGSFSERYSSFIDLLSIDRVGSSFLVDLAIFAMFQGWFIDDDFERRRNLTETGDDLTLLRNFAKYVPFFGLVTYLTFRPSLPSRTETTSTSANEL